MRRLTTLLAAGAAIAAVAAPATAPAAPNPDPGQKPYNYGTCVAYQAMFGDEPVSEFTAGSAPLTAFGDYADKVVGPKHADSSIGCRPE